MTEDEMLDVSWDEHTQIEFQRETGFPGCFKMYVHQGGRTVFRMCKIPVAVVEEIRNALVRSRI